MVCRSTTDTDSSQRAITMLLIMVVKVACRSTTATDCSHRGINILLILVELSVKLRILVEAYMKVAWRSMRAKTAGTHATYLFVNVAYRPTTATDSCHHATYSISLKVACRSTTAADCSHRLQGQSSLRYHFHRYIHQNK